MISGHVDHQNRRYEIPSKTNVDNSLLDPGKTMKSSNGHCAKFCLEQIKFFTKYLLYPVLHSVLPYW